jgi:hypothetical protein
MMLLALAIGALVMVACGTGPATDDHASDPKVEETSHPTDAASPTTTERGVVFLVQPERRPPEGPNVMMSARFTGKLVIDEEGCLRVAPGGGLRGHLPVWPPGYSLSAGGGEMRVLDAQGRSVARVGAEVYMGGGEIRKDESGGGHEERRSELGVPGKCRGPLWWVVSPVKEVARAASSQPATMDASPDAEVFFPKWTPEGRPGGLAVNSGELVLDEKGCLRLPTREGGHSAIVPVWPPDFELKSSGGEIRVLNGRGRVVARVGERVLMGGNPLDGPIKARYLVGGQATARELRERCPGGYWVAAPDRMRVIPQG